jgi:hypothetical protein
MEEEPRGAAHIDGGFLTGTADERAAHPGPREVGHEEDLEGDLAGRRDGRNGTAHRLQRWDDEHRPA